MNVTTDHKVLVKGLPASPGLVAGKAHVITDPADIDQFKEGEILVTLMTSPDWVPAMKKALAIVTDAGGMTCHASIVSRELGIPCVVGTKSRSVDATSVLKTGQEITVDAQNGIVYDGIVEDMIEKPKAEAAAAGAVVQAEYFAPTGTTVLMNLGDPDLAQKYASLPCDGIGLMREEFIWTTFIHEHPLHLIETGHPEKVIEMLAEGISKVCRAMAPRPVVLRFSDFKSGEYRNLVGGDKYEPEEPADLLGWRGASRYYDPKYINAFRLELKAVKKVREEFGLTNLNCMIPFCRTVDEARKVTEIMKEEGLQRGPDFKLFLMAEIPSNIILADQFNQYVDGYSIGSNDLTMLILGCDRNNDTVASSSMNGTSLYAVRSATSSRPLTRTARPSLSAARHRPSIRTSRNSSSAAASTAYPSTRIWSRRRNATWPASNSVCFWTLPPAEASRKRKNTIGNIRAHVRQCRLFRTAARESV